jgi:hypothetical protein
MPKGAAPGSDRAGHARADADSEPLGAADESGCRRWFPIRRHVWPEGEMTLDEVLEAVRRNEFRHRL